MNILSILNEIAETASKNEKLAILTREKDNELLKSVFKAAYDPTINYFIKKIPIPQRGCLNPDGVMLLVNAIEDLSCLSKRKFTGNSATDFLAQVLGKLSDEDVEVLSRIIQRDLKVGCSSSTANKVWKNLIPEFPYMRCILSKDAKFKNWDFSKGAYSQLKADGMYANVDIQDDGEVLITSRAGSEFDSSKFKIICESTVNFPRGTRITGELLVIRGGEILKRQVGNGILNSVLKGGKFGENEHAIFVAWDMIPLVFAVPSGRIKSPYSMRFETLGNILFTNNKQGLNGIDLIETRLVFSLGDAYEHYFEIIARGLEGTVLKNPDGEWFDGTSNDQVKMKVSFECDLKIRKFNEGNGRNKDTFGSIECSTSDDLLIVNVPGRGDEMRKLFHEDRDNLIGRIITASSNNLSKDSKTGVYSLFLPVFEELREDKFEADSLQRVIDQYESVIRPKND